MSPDLRTPMVERLSPIGTGPRQRGPPATLSLRDGFLADVGADPASGAIAPLIDRGFPITGAEAAHERVAENRTIGTIVPEVGG